VRMPPEIPSDPPPISVYSVCCSNPIPPLSQRPAGRDVRNMGQKNKNPDLE
jgi:hypothetical protein